MPLPVPHPGLVISYSYLWRDDAVRGREEGAKDRPCAIVVAMENREGETVVAVVPITHAQPADLECAVEIPLVTKRRLGLDSDRSWAVVSEANLFVWPGPDLRPISSRGPERFDYGVLPGRLHKRIVSKFFEVAQRRKLEITRRTK